MQWRSAAVKGNIGIHVILGSNVVLTQLCHFFFYSFLTICYSWCNECRMHQFFLCVEEFLPGTTRSIHTIHYTIRYFGARTLNTSQFSFTDKKCYTVQPKSLFQYNCTFTSLKLPLNSPKKKNKLWQNTYMSFLFRNPQLAGVGSSLSLLLSLSLSF